MRVAFVISTLDRCGLVNVLFDIVRNLTNEIDAKIFTLAAEPVSSRLEEFERAGIPVFCVFHSRIISMLAGSRSLRRALGQFRPDIVHAHGFRSYYLCRNVPYPTIATVHNCIFDDYATTYGQRRASWMTRKELEAFDHFDRVISCSESNADYLADRYGLKTIPICNGVDQTVFRSVSKDEKMKLREALGYNENKILFVSTGGCSERKRTLVLAKAFHHANKDKHGELHIFGEGPDYDECCSLNYEDVILHGFCTDVTPHLQCADYFASLSKSEGMPLAVLEAISCGLEVLLSDIPPHREIASKYQGARLLTNYEDELSPFFDFSRLEKGNMQNTSVFSSVCMARSYFYQYKALLDSRSGC